MKTKNRLKGVTLLILFVWFTVAILVFSDCHITSVLEVMVFSIVTLLTAVILLLVLGLICLLITYILFLIE